MRTSLFPLRMLDSGNRVTKCVIRSAGNPLEPFLVPAMLRLDFLPSYWRVIVSWKTWKVKVSADPLLFVTGPKNLPALMTMECHAICLAS